MFICSGKIELEGLILIEQKALYTRIEVVDQEKDIVGLKLIKLQNKHQFSICPDVGDVMFCSYTCVFCIYIQMHVYRQGREKQLKK